MLTSKNSDLMMRSGPVPHQSLPKESAWPSSLQELSWAFSTRPSRATIILSQKRGDSAGVRLSEHWDRLPERAAAGPAAEEPPGQR